MCFDTVENLRRFKIVNSEEQRREEMSLTTSEMTPADFAAVTGNGNNNGFDGDGWWIILFLILAMNGGWGNGFGGNNGGGYGAGNLYPWMNQAEITSDGFRDQMMNNNITSIRDGIGNLSTQLCDCCGDMQMAVSNGFAQAEIADNARQMANMNQNFAMQTAMAQGFNNLGSQFADCCCENRLGLADLKYTVATENCADRQALNEGVRDIIASQTAGTQRILDQLCADKIDAKNDEISQLRQEVLYARGQASQVAQNSAIINGVYNRLNECPVGTVPVYGEQPIFTCNNGCGCNGGCGCGA